MIVSALALLPLLHGSIHKHARHTHRIAPAAVIRPNARPIPVSPLVFMKQTRSKNTAPLMVIEPVDPTSEAMPVGAQAAKPMVELKGKIRSDLVNEDLADDEPLLKSPFVAESLSSDDTVSAKDKKICSLDVADMDLSVVLRSVSRQSGVNLVLLSTTPQKITLRLQSVPLADVIRHICAVTSLSNLKVGDIYIIAQDAQLKAAYPMEWAAAYPEKVEKVTPPDAPAAIITEVYTCSYVNASQIADAITKTYQVEKLSVQIGPSQQVPTLNQQDSTSTTGASTTLMTKTEGGSASGSEGAGSPGSRTIVIRGPTETVAAALALAKKLDVARPQVSIAVKIHDVSNDALKDLGLTWTFPKQTLTENPKSSGIGIGTFTRSPLSFTAQLNALETSNKAKVLAEPNVSVLDNEKAFILIGQRLNFPILIGYTQANTPIFDQKEVRVGIYLQVSASVSSNNEITMTLYPQVSTVTGFINVNGGSYPQIATREAQTTLRVKSGETIVMGGLINDEDVVQSEKVPILSSIPFLGELFKHRKTTHTSSQVIITITPIVTTPEKG